MSEDRPQYAATKTPPDPPPTNAEIAERLRALVHDMRDIGMTMDYVGGFGPTGTRGRELIWAARIVGDWAQEIEGARG